VVEELDFFGERLGDRGRLLLVETAEAGEVAATECERAAVEEEAEDECLNGKVSSIGAKT